jgi:hypothetical protein
MNDRDAAPSTEPLLVTDGAVGPEAPQDVPASLLGASLRGDRALLDAAFVQQGASTDEASVHRARVRWLLQLLSGTPFRWTGLDEDVFVRESPQAIDAMIFHAARIAYGDLAPSPSRAS